MRKVAITLVTLTLLNGFSSSTQGQSGQAFSLEQAITYAKANNASLQNARLDEESSNQKVREVKSMGLPQVNGSVGYTNNLQIPTQVFPNFIGQALVASDPNANPGPEFIEAQFGVKHSIVAGASLNQLIFDGTYLLGLKAASEFVNLSTQAVRMSEIDIEDNVTKAYYLVLLSEESLKLVEKNLENLEQTVKETRAFLDNGFIEKLDLDRLELSLANLKVQKQSLENQRNNSYKLLQLQMGMEVGSTLTLTDKLDQLKEASNDAALAQSGKVNFGDRIEYQMLDQQMRLNSLDKKRYQVGYYPTLYASFTYQRNTFSDEFSISEEWFPAAILGVNLNIPIFDGLRKSAQIQQADIALRKTQNDKRNLERAINVEVANGRSDYQVALQQMDQQKKSLTLAEDIYRTTDLKFKEGVGSSLDLINAERDLQNAQTNYLNSVYNLLVARTNLEKALGK